MIPCKGDLSNACIKEIKNLPQASESYFYQETTLDWTMGKKSGK